MLVSRGCKVTVCSSNNFQQKKFYQLKPDGVFLSNGPGDPEPCDYAINNIKIINGIKRLPIFGICLGHQLLALASRSKNNKNEIWTSWCQSSCSG